MDYRVFLTPRAKRDLLGIWKFIARQDSESATKFCTDLTLHAYSLKVFPDRSPEIPRRRFI
jgi:plasmid stabilization system protein ParE